MLWNFTILSIFIIIKTTLFFNTDVHECDYIRMHIPSLQGRNKYNTVPAFVTHSAISCLTGHCSSAPALHVGARFTHSQKHTPVVTFISMLLGHANSMQVLCKNRHRHNIFTRKIKYSKHPHTWAAQLIYPHLLQTLSHCCWTGKCLCCCCHLAMELIYL